MKDMNLKKAFSWQIDNFSKNMGLIVSNPFSFSGTKWKLGISPRRHGGCDYWSPSLFVARSNSLKYGWKRRVKCVFVFLNQSGKELYKSPHCLLLFCAEIDGLCATNALPRTKIQEKGFLEKDKLIIEVYIQVLEVVHRGKSTANEIVCIDGFQINTSRALSVYNVFVQHPDCALNFKPKNQGVRTAYMNLLLGLIETLNKSPNSLFGTDLSNAQSQLSELTEAGFNLDWLKSKLDKISLERKKALSDGTWVQYLEERVKTLSEIKRQSTFLDFIKSLFLSCFSISTKTKVL